MRRSYFYLSLFCILLILTVLTPRSALAEGEPTPEPIQPPWITGQNTEVTTSTRSESVMEPAGVAVDSPELIGLIPQEGGLLAGELVQLAVPQRYQDPDDPTCGAAALGMALEFLSLSEGGKAPGTETLIKDLDSSGFLYESGTGVEELAYLARAYGYRGASPFHGWSQEKLAGELAAGRPVVVSLGLNRAGQPGHFVTLTGMAADGSWVTYNDPVLGEQTLSAEEFLAAWGSQGYSGLTVQKGALAAATDPLLPWMGLLGAVSTLAVLARSYPLGSELKNILTDFQSLLADPRRKGLGGKLANVPGGGGNSSRPPHPAPEGYYWDKDTTYRYGMKNVKVIEEVEIPNMVKTWGVVRINRWFEDVPVYKTVKVDRGHWATRYVKKYRTQLYRTTERYREKKTYWYRRGGRLYKGTRYEWKTRTVWKRKKVPYYEKERYWVPKIVEEQRFVRNRQVEHRDPVYGWKEEQRGTKIEKREKIVKRWGVIETKTDWKLKKDPTPEATPGATVQPVPPKTATETPPPPTSPPFTPVPTPVPGTPVFGTPYPTIPESIECSPNEIPVLLGEGIKWYNRIDGISDASKVVYNPLNSGNFSVSVPYLLDGEKLALRLSQNIPGTYYSTQVLAKTTATSLLKKWNSGLGLSMAIPILTNAYDYGLGEHSDIGLDSPEYAASTYVDMAKAGLTGLAAAGAVAGIIGAAGALGATVVASTPLWAAALVTVGVGILINYLVDQVIDTDEVKQDVADGFGTFPGIWENGQIIVSASEKRLEEAITDAEGQFMKAVNHTVEQIEEAARDSAGIVIDAVSGATDLITGLFGSDG